MNSQSPVRLARLDPARLQRRVDCEQPSEWDRLVVQADLNAYVDRARMVKATPHVRIMDDGQLAVISGSPFVLAAQQAKPPVSPVVCSVSVAREGLGGGVDFVQVSDLIDDSSPQRTYLASELLMFQHSLEVEQRNAVEARIAAYCAETTRTRSYESRWQLKSFEWRPDNTALWWQWMRTDQVGPNPLGLRELFNRINGLGVAVRSWNGLRLV